MSVGHKDDALRHLKSAIRSMLAFALALNAPCLLSLAQAQNEPKNAAYPKGEISELPDIEARTYEINVVDETRSKRVYLFSDPIGAGPKVGKVLLVKKQLEQEPIFAVRVLKTFPNKRQFAGKRVRLYASLDQLPVAGEALQAIEKISDLSPFPAVTRKIEDRLDIEELAELQARQKEEQAALEPPISPQFADEQAALDGSLAGEAPPQDPVEAPMEAAGPMETFPEGYVPEEGDPAEIDAQSQMAQIPQEPLPQADARSAEALPPVAEDELTPEQVEEAIAQNEAGDATQLAQNDVSEPAPDEPAPAAPPERSVKNAGGLPQVSAYDHELDAGITPASEGDDYIDSGESDVEAKPVKPLIDDSNELGMVGGFFRNVTLSSSSTYYSGLGFNYAHLFSKMSKYKSATLQDGVFGEATVALYRVFNYSSGSDSATVMPIIVKGRYQLFIGGNVGVYGYAGLLKNFVVSATNMSNAGISRLNSFLPALGIGAEFKIGPRWQFKVDLGLDLTTIGLLVRF